MTELGAHQQLHIVAVDPVNDRVPQLALPEHAGGLPRPASGQWPGSASPFHAAETHHLVAAGEKFVLPDITTSRFELYDSLARVYALYATLSNDPKLAEFRFLLNWPQLCRREEARTVLQVRLPRAELLPRRRKTPRSSRKSWRPYLAQQVHKTFLDEWLAR